eukprot:TRINITY_DN59746_c0_g1_i2.p1 TRINITY_DN59746_c0_g1~~TRINITY_DN59746_c0_g1_i2.p1  ORF type:complete len:366 (+),score=10.42 TRINITY_DN59746_c0_g1_i2:96-1193(+)
MGRAVLANRNHDDREHEVRKPYEDRSSHGAVSSGWQTSGHESQGSDLRSVFIIGIAGPSGSGKSTVANKIAKALWSPIKPISLDWYLEPKWMPRDRKHGKNWETPRGCDFDFLRRDLQRMQEVFGKAQQVPSEVPVSREGQDIVRHDKDVKMAGQWLDDRPVVIVVEGFLVFYDEALAGMMHAQIWLEADFDTCLMRRHNRGKASRWKKEPNVEWFRDLVWYHYEWNKSTQRANSRDALCLDATVDKTTLEDTALDYAKNMLCRSTDNTRSERATTPSIDTLRVTLRPRSNAQEASHSWRNTNQDPRTWQRYSQCPSRGESPRARSRSRARHGRNCSDRYASEKHVWDGCYAEQQNARESWPWQG